MALTYTLHVAGTPAHTGTFDEVAALPADAIARASTHGVVLIKARDLAELINTDTNSTVDLRLLPPQITVEVSPA